MIGKAVSFHSDYPCQRIVVRNNYLGVLIDSIYRPGKQYWWGTSEDIVFNGRLNTLSYIDLQIDFKCPDRSTLYTCEIPVCLDDFSGIMIIGVTNNGDVALWNHKQDSTELISLYRSSGKTSQRVGWYKKYSYRINPRLDAPYINDKSWIKLDRFDGTYDTTKFGESGSYKSSALPRRLSVNISGHKSHHSINVWFRYSEIKAVFDKMIGIHIDNCMDFIIRIDAENKKYELALYRQGLKEPVVIPESAYQLIVFKNKFEDYRSENYNQPRGAWIW